MNKHITDMRNALAKFLHGAAAIVMASYQRYLNTDFPKDQNAEPLNASDFKAYHDAGKSAASHLDALIKLAKNTEETAEEKEARENREKEEEIRKAMSDAREEIDGR